MRCRNCGSVIPKGMYQCAKCNAFGDFMSEKQEKAYNRMLFLDRYKSLLLLITIFLLMINFIKRIKKK